MATTTDPALTPAAGGGGGGRKRDGMGLAQKVALNAGSQAGSQLFSAIAGVLSVGIAARYLSVGEYGEVVTAVVLSGLLYFAADFGITPTAARMAARHEGDASRIYAGAFWAGVMFNALTIAAIFAISRGIYSGTDNSTTRIAVLLLLTSYLLKPWAGVTRAKAIVQQQQYLMSLATVLARTMSLLTLGITVALDLGPIGVAAGFAVGMVFEDVFSLTLLRPRLGLVPDRRGGRGREIIGSAIPLGTILIVNGLYFKTAALLLSLLSTDRDVALYGVAYKAFEVLFALPGFIMLTLLPELARLDAGEPRFNAMVQKAFTAMALLALPIVGMSLCGKEMMQVLGGGQYGDAGGLLAFVLASVTLACVQGVFGYTLVSQGRQGVLLKVSLLVLVINVVGNLILIPTLGLTGAGIALLCSEVTSIVLTMLVYRGIAPLPRLQAPLRTGLAVVAMLGATSVRLLFDHPVPGLLAAGVLGLAAYVGTLLALRAVPDELRNMFAGVLRRRRPRRVPA
jgi:O-antigen/teichoic acid export membrane protein